MEGRDGSRYTQRKVGYSETMAGYSGHHGRLWVGAEPQTTPSVVAQAKNTHLEGRLRRRVGCAGATRQGIQTLVSHEAEEQQALVVCRREELMSPPATSMDTSPDI